MPSRRRDHSGTPLRLTRMRGAGNVVAPMSVSHSPSPFRVVLPLTLLALAVAATAQEQKPHDAVRADRRFTYLDESLHGAHPGEFEVENWVTWSRGTRFDSGVDRVDFKHEIEFGLSENVVAAIDLVEWHTSEETGDWVTKYDGTGGELRFRLADPREGIGAAFKTELGVGPREIEWENELILDKWIGRWVVAYNLKLEAEFEGDRSWHFEEGELAVSQALGASYEIVPVLLAGAEFVYEIPPEWSWGDRQNFFIGPNLSIRGDECALTTTALFLADGEAVAPEFQLRVLFEFDF